MRVVAILGDVGDVGGEGSTVVENAMAVVTVETSGDM